MTERYRVICGDVKTVFTTRELPYFLFLKSEPHGAALSTLVFISRVETGGNRVIWGCPQMLDYFL